MAERVEVTSADIARLADVRPSAVTNWRRRHANFPAPVGGSDKSPTFDLAQVAEWLRRQGRSVDIPLPELLWRTLESLRDAPLSTGDNLGIVGLFLLHMHGHLSDIPTGRHGFIRALTRAEHAMLLRGDRVVAGLNSLLTPIDLTDDQLAVLRLAAQCAVTETPAATFDHLCQRFFERGALNGFTPTPPELAELMLHLAQPGRGTLLDPACGSAEILRAAIRKGYHQILGQETNPALARIAVMRLTFATPSATDPRFDVHEGDSLREDAYPAGNAQTVICNPPFAERKWGHEELGLDARWEYGVPPRIESELAWVQHCLAHAATGSTVIVLMPPAAASRPSGRRIRTALVTRGTLRAVIAIPPRLAAQYAVALQLWILQPPDASRRAPSNVLFLDASDHVASSSSPDDPSAWALVRDLTIRAWTAFQEDSGSVAGVPQARVVPAADILHGEVDLTPRRYLPTPSLDAPDDGLPALHRRVQDLLARLPAATPVVTPKIGPPTPARIVSLQELVHTGAIFVRRTPAREPNANMRTSRSLIVRAEDLVRGQPPGDVAEVPDDPLQRVQPGDVLIPLVASHMIARVADDDYAGAYLTSSVLLMRVNSTLIDAGFLAGDLSSGRGAHQARRTAVPPNEQVRFDPRRVRIPLPELRTQ